MKIEYDEKKKRIVIDAEGTTLFKDVAGKKVLVPALESWGIEIKNDASEPKLEFLPVEIDFISVSIRKACHSEGGLKYIAWPIQVSILNGGDHGIDDDDGNALPGEILTIEGARTLAKALNDAADFVEGVLTEKIG